MRGFGLLRIGPALLPPNALACTTDADCPSVQMCLPAQSTGALTCHWPPQSRWKFIITHEAGHQIQGRAMGTFGGSYTFSCPEGTTCPGKREGSGVGDGPLVDPPFTDDLCGCQHVEAANAQHCLQSIEEAPCAHVEGYGQFYASKVWNRRDQNDCTFTYYEEFLNPENTHCPPGNECKTFISPKHGPLVSVFPPVAVSCKTPFVKPGGVTTNWRNNFCPNGDSAQFTTELDFMFMGFLLNISSAPPALRSSMEDISASYRHACHPTDAVPGLCVVADVAWEPVRDATTGAPIRPGFREGAELRKGLDTDPFDFIVEQGRVFSVTPELAP